MPTDAGNKRSLKTHRAVRACLDPFVPLTITTTTLSLSDHNNVSRMDGVDRPPLTTAPAEAPAIAQTNYWIRSEGELRIVGAPDILNNPESVKFCLRLGFLY